MPGRDIHEAEADLSPLATVLAAIVSVFVIVMMALFLQHFYGVG